MSGAPSRDPRGDVRSIKTRSRGSSTLALTVRTALAALAASVAMAAGLAWQMASGGDPALGASAQANSSDKRVIRTTVVRRVVEPQSSSASPAGSGYSVTPSAPVVSSPAPVTSSTS